METEYSYLLQLLGAWLQEREPQKQKDADWIRLVQLAQIHCVTGILGYMAMKYDICPDPELRSHLRRSCLETTALFAQRGRAMEKLSEKLTGAGIDHIIMKGFELRNDYPVPELRTYGDIDLVIHPKDREKCHRLFLDEGFQVETDWEPVFSYIRGNEFYEVHVDIMEVDVSSRADYRAYFRDMWRHVRLAEGRSYRFTPEFHFLYMLTHIAKHITGSGAGARMYLDVAAFLLRRREQVDWNWVERELEALSLKHFASTVLACVETWFGVASPIPIARPDPRVLEEFTEFTMEAGVFGRFQREGAVSTLKKQPNEGSSRMMVLARRLFPAGKTIRNRYTYLNRHPWLLPVAWVHRLVKTRDTWNEHAHEVEAILTADQREVDRLARLSRDIGL